MPVKNIVKYKKFIENDRIIIHDNNPTQMSNTGTHFYRPLTKLEQKQLKGS